ncbi:hypothetical protein Taro_031131 [Colocasia esculenta]|uniref:inositol-1,3,4-trisphosphate 5/6-kinase n=1 Tax=Colocasia esculenta TaxID=4460 RepID=A0A843VZZ1_COLES|nr:hypothetical protein [Colocasia esculenta]
MHVTRVDRERGRESRRRPSGDQMGAVRAVLLDECLLCVEDEGGDTYHLLPGAATLLGRLQYSKLRVAICCQEGAKSTKVNFLLQVAVTYALEPICWRLSSSGNISVELLQAWNTPRGSCVLATSSRDKNFFDKICSEGWRVIVRGVGVDLAENENLLFIEKLEELLFTLCRFNKMAICDTSITTIGYVMKPSREEDFLKRGAFPMFPTEGGLIFVPLNLGSPLSCQMQVVDAVLHKATDEIVSIDPSTSLDFPKGITYSRGMQELERYMQDHPQCCMIDPLYNVYPLLDRFRIQQLLLGLNDLNIKTECRIRAPHFLKTGKSHFGVFEEQLERSRRLQDQRLFDLQEVDSRGCHVSVEEGSSEVNRKMVNRAFPDLWFVFIGQFLFSGDLEAEFSRRTIPSSRGDHDKVDDFVDPTLKEKLCIAKLSFPNIVKPQVACGVADAHKMALVFKYEDFEHLHIPLPAIVQEYVDHGSTIFKFYVLGEKVFHAVKKSMPNADVFLSTSGENGCTPIIFDSLKSLPTAEGKLDAFKEQKHYLDIELVKNAAKWLRRCLDLTIFGFDIVIEEGSGDHVIVDVNYLPSFKEVPVGDAIPAFWDAIKCTYETRKLKSTSPAGSSLV